MEKQDFLNSIQEIGTCEDDVQRRELLATLSDEVSKDYDRITELTESNTTLTSANETLRDANMKLFLRVGEERSASERLQNETGVEPPKEKLTFENLFNEKGELK